MQPEGHGNDGSFRQLALSNKGKRKYLKAKIFLLSFDHYLLNANHSNDPSAEALGRGNGNGAG